MVGAIRSEHGLGNAFTIYDQNVLIYDCVTWRKFSLNTKWARSKKNSRNNEREREIIKETEEFVALMR